MICLFIPKAALFFLDSLLAPTFIRYSDLWLFFVCEFILLTWHTSLNLEKITRQFFFPERFKSYGVLHWPSLCTRYYHWIAGTHRLGLSSLCAATATLGGGVWPRAWGWPGGGSGSQLHVWLLTFWYKLSWCEVWLCFNMGNAIYMPHILKSVEKYIF